MRRLLRDVAENRSSVTPPPWPTWGAMFGGGGRDRNDNVIGQLALIILAPLAAGLLQMALSRSREYEADRSAARMLGTGEPLGPGAREARPWNSHGALQRGPGPGRRLHRQPVQRAAKVQFSKLFTTHPPMEDRIARLRGGEWQ
jgi:heat shock protein HtpX